MTGTTIPALSVVDVRKTFGHVQALRGVSFDLMPGEVLSVVGDNGAGKSTLMKVLSGVYSPDHGGRVQIRGEDVTLASPTVALQSGIATVYQDLSLVDTRDVAANLFLGRELRRGPFVDRKRMIAESERVLSELTMNLPSVKVPVSYLSGGQRQAVAIARVLLHGPEVVILDEPTAALGVQESKRVLDVVQRLKDSGTSVIIVSHNLQQVWDITDRFMAMRLGSVAGIRDKSATSVDEIVRLIVYGDESRATA
jgi:ABC-type sugar transport system ATPase subunit